MKDAKLIVIQADNQRIGQKMFNFLSWLHQEKGMGTNQCGRLADPFFISDNKLINYWEEYENSIII